MKQMNRSLAIAWLCIVCIMTPIPKAQSQTTIFSDNFSGNSIDATLTGQPSGKTLKAYVIAANDAGQAAPSDTVTIVVP